MLKILKFLEIGSTKKICFLKFYLIINFYLFFWWKSSPLYIYFSKYKGTMTTFMTLLLRPLTLSFLKISKNQWRLAYRNLKLHLVFALQTKSLMTWPQLIHTYIFILLAINQHKKHLELARFSAIFLRENYPMWGQV